MTSTTTKFRTHPIDSIVRVKPDAESAFRGQTGKVVRVYPEVGTHHVRLDTNGAIIPFAAGELVPYDGPVKLDRRVTVRYRVAVYATVDLNSGVVVDVNMDESSIRLDMDGVKAAVVEPAFDEAGNPIAVTIDQTVVRQAIEIAERTGWPAWDR